jgi:SWI/SNF-related matrix-associated actin-dependent regulator 1 of chromatin subfamily A
MQLVYNDQKLRFEFQCDKHERQVPKDAGFRFDWDTNAWHTNDPHNAEKVMHYGSKDMQLKIKDAKEASKPKLYWDGDLYIWKSSIAYKDLPKQAGFKWNPETLSWESSQWEQAIKLIQYTDKDTEEHVKAAKKQYEVALEQSRAASADVNLKVPAGLDYLPYQKAGIQYGLQRDAILLSDSMGLGKSIQTIGILNNNRNLKKILLVCPASLKINWKRELEKWLVNPLSIEIVDSKKPLLPNADILICNYDIAHKYRDQLYAIQWDVLIADEAHYMKNPNTNRARAILGKYDNKGNEVLPPIRALKKILLTGTPIPNRVKEVWPLIRYLDPERWNNFFAFAKRYCDAFKGRYGWNFDGASYLDELQNTLRSTVMIRRLKEEVLKELPPKIRQVIHLDTTGATSLIKREQEAYIRFEELTAYLQAQVELAKLASERDYEEAVRALSEHKRVAFREISKMRHELALKKAPAVIDFINDSLEDSDHKIILFAHHSDVIAQFKEAFGDKAVVLTGSTSMKDRQESVDRFQNDPYIKIFIGNIIAAGVGLTLTASSHVIFAELDWVPGNMQQCEDRSSRIGQKNTVLVQHLVFDGSLDASMAQTLIEKQQVMDAALDDKNSYELDTTAISSLPRDSEPVFLDKELASQRQQIYVKLDEINRIGDTLTVDDITDIHYKLKRLAGLCDGAKEVDGLGFNKVDSHIGKKLAAQLGLTKREAALGLKLVTKYKKQLD